MATDTFYPTSVDGTVRRYTGSETWQQAHDASSGTDVYDTLTSTNVVYSSNSLGLVTRGFLCFDTSALPNNAVVTSARLRLYGVSKTGTVGSVEVVGSTQASTSALVAADFSRAGTTPFATGINVSSLSTSGYNDFNFITAGLAAVNLTGFTKIAVRHSSDLNNSAPASDAGFTCYFSEQSGTSNDPVLEVTWNYAGTTADTWAWSDSAVVSGHSGGTINTFSRTTGDAWAWTDTTAKPTTDRTAGTERTVWAGGTIGTNSAHYAFPFVVASGGNGRLLAVARKATSHTAYDGSLVAKISNDDGNSWGTEYTILDNATTGYDERDPGLVKLASGRLCLVNGKRQNTSGFAISGQPKFYYSDDDGLTWSSGVSIPTGLYGGTANTKYGLIYGSDVVELHNGDLLVVGYGSKDSTNNTQFDIFCAKSTDGGASWTNIGYPVTYGSHSANAVEPQIAILGSGKLILTYHVENGPPQDGYIRTSTDGGVTWSAATLITTTSNRQGLAVMDDGSTVIVSYVTTYGAQSFSYIESRNGGTSFGNGPTQIGNMSASSLYGLWAMSASLSGIGNQQNVGFIYNGENAGQTQASIFYKQFSGMDGTFVYQRAATDAWAWTDTARISAHGRVAADAWAWSDAATRTAPKSRLASDAWAWSDTAGRQATYSRISRANFFGGIDTETWAWSDSAVGIPGGVRSTSDSWAWSDAAGLGGSGAPRSTADSWAWTDAASKTQAFSRISFADFFGGISHETWLWSDSAARTVVPVGASRGSSDAWAWTDAAGRGITVFVRALTDSWAWHDVALASGDGVVVPLVLRPEGLPAETLVGVYRRWEWKGSELARLGAGPGAAVQTAVVGSDLTVALTGLDDGEWVLYAPAYPNRRLFFMVGQP